MFGGGGKGEGEGGVVWEDERKGERGEKRMQVLIIFFQSFPYTALRNLLFVLSFFDFSF